MLDIAVAYDPVTHRCDLVFNGRDFALDSTPASLMLLTLGSDRRAHTDDVLPDSVSETNPANPGTLMARRGWPGDALDPQGRLSGSRWWVFQDAKATEATRRNFEGATTEALGPAAAARNLVLQVTVRWIRKGVLGVRARLGRTTVALNQSLTAGAQ